MKLLLLVVFVGFAAASSYSEDDPLFYVDEILDEKPTSNTFLERVKARLNNVVEWLQTRAAKNEEVLKDFAEKLTAVKDKIQDLTGKVGGAVFRKIRDIGNDLKVLRRDIFKRLGGKSKDYAADNSDIRGVFLRIKAYLPTEEGIAKVRDYVRGLEVKHPVIFLIKAFIEGSTNEVLIELFHEVTKDLTFYSPDNRVYSSIHDDFVRAKEFLQTEDGLKAVKGYFENMETNHAIISRLKSLVVSANDEVIREVMDAILPDVYYNSQQDYDVKERLMTLFSDIRKILVTDAGLKAVRDYARSLQIRHPVLFLVKAFIESSSDQTLLEILDEIFKPSDNVYAHTVLGELFHEVREILSTDEGFQTLKNYLINIKSSHPIVSRLEGFMKAASDESLREILEALFPEID